MRVIVPHTHIRPETRSGIFAAGVSWEGRNVSAGDDAYWHLLAALWAEGRSFAIVEHDIVVRPDSLAELARCDSPWCAFTTDYVGMEYAGLGCAKFRADLLARHPDALHAISTIGDATHPPKHWCRLDAWLQGYLTSHGETLCVHGPALEHVRDEPGQVKPTHGCWK